METLGSLQKNDDPTQIPTGTLCPQQLSAGWRLRRFEMFRTNDESRGSFDFDLSQRSLPHDSPGTNKSFISTSSSTAGIALQSTASSSKAVLAALRALQDKIRRLESEKAQALDDAAQLRTQLKSLEIENDHTRERDALHSQKLLQDARMAYEKVLSEKTDMENRLRTLDKQLEKVTSDLNSAVNENKDLEVSKRSGSEKLQQLENQILEMELKLQESMQKEQGLPSPSFPSSSHLIFRTLERHGVGDPATRRGDPQSQESSRVSNKRSFCFVFATS
jgi:myosin heavy subunit